MLQNKMLHKKLLDFGRFLTKKQPKLFINEENWLKPNRLVKFSVIWFATKQNATKKLFWISAVF